MAWISYQIRMLSYIYWTVHHLDSWIKRDQLDVTCFIISLFNAQHVSDPSSGACDYLLSYFMGCIALVRCDSNTTHEITQQISRELLRMDVLTSETCWALNNEIIKQVTSSWSLFIQRMLSFACCYLDGLVRIIPTTAVTSLGVLRITENFHTAFILGPIFILGTAVAQWLRCCATNR